MKKYIALALANVLVCLIFTSCGAAKPAALQTTAESSKQTEITSQIISTQPIVTTANETTTEASKSKTVVFNEAFNVGNIMTITLQSSEWCEKILPSNTSDFYSYIPEHTGERYFVIRGELKNLASEKFDIGFPSDAEMIINNKYKVPVYLDLENSEGTSFSESIKPLQTLNLIAYASVSDELFEICDTIQITIDIITDESKLWYIYDDANPHDSFLISLNK